MPVTMPVAFDRAIKSSLYKYVSWLVVLSMPHGSSAADINVSPVTSAAYQYIYVTDVIDSGDDAKLHEALEQVVAAGKQPVIELTSRGGDVDVSMAMGRDIRRHNAVTYHGSCASSCVFAFLGGVQRFDEKGTDSKLIIHRPELAEAYVANPTAGARAMLDMLEGYIVEMTGTNALNSLMMQVPFSEQHALTPEEARTTHAITGTIQ